MHTIIVETMSIESAEQGGEKAFNSGTGNVPITFLRQNNRKPHHKIK